MTSKNPDGQALVRALLDGNRQFRDAIEASSLLMLPALIDDLDNLDEEAAQREPLCVLLALSDPTAAIDPLYFNLPPGSLKTIARASELSASALGHRLELAIPRTSHRAVVVVAFGRHKEDDRLERELRRFRTEILGANDSLRDSVMRGRTSWIELRFDPERRLAWVAGDGDEARSRVGFASRWRAIVFATPLRSE